MSGHSGMFANEKIIARKTQTKTFETQRNRVSGGQKEETGKLKLEEQEPNPTARRSWKESRDNFFNSSAASVTLRFKGLGVGFAVAVEFSLVAAQHSRPIIQVAQPPETGPDQAGIEFLERSSGLLCQSQGFGVGFFR